MPPKAHFGVATLCSLTLCAVVPSVSLFSLRVGPRAAFLNRFQVRCTVFRKQKGEISIGSEETLSQRKCLAPLTPREVTY